MGRTGTADGDLGCIPGINAHWISIRGAHSELSNKHAANLILFEKISHLHALLEPTRLFIFRENYYLHDY